MRTTKLGVLAVALALTVTACGGNGNGSDSDSNGEAGGSGGGGELKIGVINPFSGPNAPGGEAVYEGYEIAVEQANANGGVLGRQVTLLRADAVTPEQGVSEVNRLATSDDVDVFAGTYLSGTANTASETALRYDKLYWETNAVAGDLTERGLDNFVRTGPMATQFAQVAGDAVEDVIPDNIGMELRSMTACVTHEESIYGTSISEAVVERLETLGVEVSSVIAYPSTAPDLGNVILRCRQDNPDVWIQTGYVADVNLLLRTAQQQDFDPTATMLIGSGDTRLTLEAVTGEVLEGVFVVGYPHFDIQDDYAPGAAEFLEAYVEKNGGEPTFPQTLTAYAGLQMLLDAIEEADSTSPADVMEVIDAWDKPLSTYASGFGAQFDDDRQNVLALPTLTQWQGSESVTVYPDEARLPDAEILPSN